MSLVENVYWCSDGRNFFGSLIGDTETQRVNASYANGKKTLSAEVVPEGEVGKEVAISGLVLATAVPSGGNAGAGLLLTTTAPKASVVGSLVRFGQKAESAEELANQAAEANGFPHGVSTKKVDQVKGSDKAHKNAKLSEVEQAFKVEQTGNKAAHHTVHLPKPVTQSVANLFNSIFKPLE